jgi:transposase
MGRKADENKKELAFALYMMGEQNNRIAERVGVSEKTVGTWSDKFGWKERRAAVEVSRPEIVNKLLKAINDLIDKNDIDADKLSKLSATIERIEKKDSLVNHINTFMQFGEYLNRLVGTELTSDEVKMIVRLQDRFIQEKI